MLAASGWLGGEGDLPPLYDPCCGSGTIAIEVGANGLESPQAVVALCLRALSAHGPACLGCYKK
jgi:23S rRNA G2445 N2-methylase RlmL